MFLSRIVLPFLKTVLVQSGTFNFEQWKGSHQPEHTRPTLDKVIDALKEQGVTSFAAVGYCFGGK
jgi:dienelactone hydrolase